MPVINHVNRVKSSFVATLTNINASTRAGVGVEVEVVDIVVVIVIDLVAFFLVLLPAVGFFSSVVHTKSSLVNICKLSDKNLSEPLYLV